MYLSNSIGYSIGSCGCGYMPMDFGIGNSNIYSPQSSPIQQYQPRGNTTTRYHASAPQTTNTKNISHNILGAGQFDPESFLDTYRLPTKFIGKAQEIQNLVEECFEKTLGNKIPDNILIRICDNKELKTIHETFGGKWVQGIVGFAINRNKNNRINEIFIKEDSLDKVMVTIGHEIGHILGRSLLGKKEEAKAFAFELAWLDTIREHNIGGIGKNIIQINPANNGFHDLAFDFVINLVRNGQRAIDVFKDLVYS